MTFRRRRSHIQQRRPVYIGCEGASEAAYAAFLQDLLRAANLPVHLVIKQLAPGAGDPLARVDMAVRQLTQLRRTRTDPADCFVLLDYDQVERNPQRAEQVERKANENEIVIVWQRPCFEAVLLRHIQGCTDRRPPDTPEAGRTLAQEWPEYRKGMTRRDLAKRLDRNAVLRAATVEPELRDLLTRLGLM